MQTNISDVVRSQRFAETRRKSLARIDLSPVGRKSFPTSPTLDMNVCVTDTVDMVAGK